MSDCSDRNFSGVQTYLRRGKKERGRAESNMCAGEEGGCVLSWGGEREKRKGKEEEQEERVKRKKKAVGGGNPQTKIRNFEERYAFEHVCWRRNVVHLFF